MTLSKSTSRLLHQQLKQKSSQISLYQLTAASYTTPPNPNNSKKTPPHPSFYENDVETPKGAPSNGMLWGVDMTRKSEEPRGNALGPFMDERGAHLPAPRGMLNHNQYYHFYMMILFSGFVALLVVLSGYTPFSVPSAREELHSRMAKIEDFTKWLNEQPEEVQDEYKNIIRRGIEKRINRNI